MENKVKIWGKEVERCMLCLYYYGYEGCCNITGEHIDPISNDNINSKCPFLKPISKEVIEGFGFVEQPKLNSNFADVYRNEKNLQIINYGNIILIDRYYEYESTLFKGTINNPIELEFILKSIGVIE